MQKYNEILSTFELFENIEADNILKLLNCLNSEFKSFKKDEIVWLAGEKPSKIGIVIEGSVQIQKNDIMGMRSILTKCGVGEIFGEAYNFARSEVLSVTVSTLEDSNILLFDGKNIAFSCSNACKFHNTLRENMLYIMAQKNMYLNRKNEILSQRSIRSKLLTYFSDLSLEKRKSVITIPFNRQELADYIAVDRSALSTELGKMKKDGILDYNKNEFILLL